MINRNVYLKKLIESKDNGFPKVVTGIRRCGKSYLLKTIYKEYLISTGVPESNILVIELDDIFNIGLRNPIELSKYILSYCEGKSNCYVFVDEIQLVTKIINPAFTNGAIVPCSEARDDLITFVDVVLGVSRKDNIDLYVTGSNSKMLSTDILTEFRDKATNIHLMPLSFEEFCSYRGGDPSSLLKEYLSYGGMPLSVLRKVDEKKEYLKSLFNTTYLRDILERNKLNKNTVLDELCNVLSSCSGQLISIDTITNTFISKTKTRVSKETVATYIDYLKDAFLVSEASRFDIKGRRNIGASRKYYFSDLGLRNARLNFAYEDSGQMLENFIYNELQYNGFNVNVGVLECYGKDDNGKTIRLDYEIDFIARKNLKTYYIQVCDNIDAAGVMQREVKPLNKLSIPGERILVINKDIPEMIDSFGNTVIGVVDFVLRFLKK